jgi:hypothetical protein
MEKEDEEPESKIIYQNAMLSTFITQMVNNACVWLDLCASE